MISESQDSTDKRRFGVTPDEEAALKTYIEKGEGAMLPDGPTVPAEPFRAVSLAEQAALEAYIASGGGGAILPDDPVDIETLPRPLTEDDKNQGSPD